MLTDSQFKTVRILYIVIGCVLLLVGMVLSMSDSVRVKVSGILPIIVACLLFFDVRISKIERKRRLDESEKK